MPPCTGESGSAGGHAVHVSFETSKAKHSPTIHEGTWFLVFVVSISDYAWLAITLRLHQPLPFLLCCFNLHFQTNLLLVSRDNNWSEYHGGQALPPLFQNIKYWKQNAYFVTDHSLLTYWNTVLNNNAAFLAMSGLTEHTKHHSTQSNDRWVVPYHRTLYWFQPSRFQLPLLINH